MMLTGGCFCGQARYEAGPAAHDATACHCSACRRTTGAPFVAWFTVPRAAFRLVSGTLARFASSPGGLRSFCPVCGTQLTFAGDDRPLDIDVATCSLDDPSQAPPQDHTWHDGKVSWVHLADGLPTHPAARPL